MRDYTLNRKVGKRIQELRYAKNMTQQALADKCDYEKSYLSRLESGITDARLSTYNKVAEGLEVSLSELFKFKD